MLSDFKYFIDYQVNKFLKQTQKTNTYFLILREKY
jgi:hypothetical protein